MAKEQMLRNQLKRGARKYKQVSYQELPKAKPEPKPEPKSEPKPEPKPKTPSALLMLRLERLTRSPATAKRLVESNQAKFPDRSLNWCCEKAIRDLERDRGRG
jgi:outer membrane biosynthesis protein TonB